MQSVEIQGIDRQRLFDVAASAIKVAGVHFDGTSQAQELRSARATVVQPADLLLRNLKMAVSGTCISLALIQCCQIHVQLNAVQRPFDGALGQMNQGSVIFANSVFGAFLKSGDFPEDGVQPIVFRIESCGRWTKGPAPSTEPAATSACAAESCKPRSCGAALAACAYSFAASSCWPLS